MKIKLKKSEIDEGITEELLSKVNMSIKSNPVMFCKDDQPTIILRCGTGYWRGIENEQFERDQRGNLVVYDERTCTIARARYLLYHIEDEMQSKADAILRERKKKIQEKLDIFKKNIEDLKEYRNPSSLLSSLSKALEGQMDEEQRKMIREENKRKVERIPEMERQYSFLLFEFEKENYNYLLNVLGIEKIENPITFKYDNEDDMKALKAAFSAEAIEKYDGDVNKMYARLAAETQ